MTRADRIQKFRRLLTIQHSLEPRFCTACRCQRPREGGREIALKGGLRARWVCGKHQQGEQA